MAVYTPYIYCSSYKSLFICWWKLRHRRRGSLIATGLPSSLMIYPALPLQYTSFLVSHECCTATYFLDLAIKWQCRQLINVRRSINVNGRIHTSENIKSVVEAWLINKKGRTRMEQKLWRFSSWRTSFISYGHLKHLGRYKARGSYLVIITPNVDSSQMFSHAISQLNFQVLNCETYLNTKW
jgi:hypothetical protein